MLNPNAKKNALVYVDPQNTSVVKYNANNETFSFYYAHGKRLNLMTYESGDSCGGSELLVDYFCVSYEGLDYIQERFHPRSCGSTYFEGDCTPQCEYFSYKWENSTRCAKVCPPLYEIDSKNKSQCVFKGYNITQCQVNSNFYQDGACAENCTGEYLAPANRSNSECQLVCSNGEYLSDGMCVYECDDLEYLGAHGGCHGCLDKSYDGGDCFNASAADAAPADSRSRCEADRSYRERATTNLGRRLRECVEKCGPTEFLYGLYECTEDCSAKPEKPFSSVDNGVRVCVSDCGSSRANLTGFCVGLESVKETALVDPACAFVGDSRVLAPGRVCTFADGLDFTDSRADARLVNVRSLVKVAANLYGLFAFGEKVGVSNGVFYLQNVSVESAGDNGQAVLVDLFGEGA